MPADPKLMEFITSELARGKAVSNLQDTDDLIGTEVMDSLGIMKLILFLEDNYPVKISDEDLTLENFSTIQSIHGLVQKKVNT